MLSADQLRVLVAAETRDRRQGRRRRSPGQPRLLERLNQCRPAGQRSAGSPRVVEPDVAHSPRPRPGTTAGMCPCVSARTCCARAWIGGTSCASSRRWNIPSPGNLADAMPAVRWTRSHRLQSLSNRRLTSRPSRTSLRFVRANAGLPSLPQQQGGRLPGTDRACPDSLRLGESGAGGGPYRR